MKKALVILLVLAVTGGLFAQGWTFSGRMDAGYGLYKADGRATLGGVLAQDQAVNGPRMFFDANYTNDNKNAGMNIRFRSQGTPTGGWTGGIAAHMRYAYGWLTALDGLLRAEAGRIQATPFDSLDPISNGENFFDSYGVLGYVKPIDILTIGGGVGSTFGLFEQTTLPDPTPADPNNTKNVRYNFVDKSIAYFGFNVLVPDTFRLNGMVRLSQGATAGAFQNSRAALGFSFLGVKDLKLVVQGVFRGLDRFSDWGSMHFYEYFAYNGVENLSLNLALTEAAHQADNTDLYFRAWFWLTYALNEGAILPRLDFNYVMGGRWTPNYGLAYNDSFNDNGNYTTACYTYDKDQTFMTITPSVAFRINGNCFIALGYMLGVDLSGKENNVQKTAFTGARDKGINHATFVDLRVSF